MNEVSYRLLAPFFEAIESAGLNVDSLLVDLPLTRADSLKTRGGFSWNVFATLIRLVVDRLGGIAAFEALTYEASCRPPLPVIVPIARALVRPRDICWMGARWLGPSLFPLVRAEFRDLPDGRVHQVLRIPPGYADLPEFFYAMRATMRAAPNLVGMGSAHVEMELSERSASYTVTFPSRKSRPGDTAAPHVQGVLEREVLKSIEEMGSQLEELHSTQAALREMNHELEDRVRERSQELLESRARLQESQRLVSLGTLAAGIAHEINNPLAAIQATAQLAQVARSHAHEATAEESEALADRTLSKIVEESQRCSRIVRSLLQFARDEPTEKWPLLSTGVASRSIEMVRRDAEEAGVLLEAEFAEKPLGIVGNPIQLEQLLMNLLRNAIQATPPSGRVTLRTGAYGEYVRFAVTDSGCGIDDANLARIFEPFFTTRLEEGGTGLGLSMAHGIAEDHDGRLQVETQVGVGTTVQLDLPLA